MKRALLVLGFVCLATSVQAQEFQSLRIPTIAIIGGQAADSITSHIALRNGAREVILTQTAWKNDVILGSVAVGELWLLHHAKNRKAAFWGGILIAAVHGVIAWNNVRVISRATAPIEQE